MKFVKYLWPSQFSKILFHTIYKNGHLNDFVELFVDLGDCAHIGQVASSTKLMFYRTTYQFFVITDS
jgi:hypothetical protein